MTSEEEQALFGQLEDGFQKILDEGVDNLQSWSTGQLLKELADITNKITDARQVLYPRTQEARDMHSRRNAIQVELRRRDVL